MLCLVVCVACSHLAYTSLKFPVASLFIFGYALGLALLAIQPTIRRAFYFGFAAGFLCIAPQSFFFWKIFGPAAIALWVVLAFWIGMFGAIICKSFQLWGPRQTVWLIPVVWTGLEYFRSELYYLKFSWLNIGYAFSNFHVFPFGLFGMYGIGFCVMGIASVFLFLRPKAASMIVIPCIAFGSLSTLLRPASEADSQLSLAGVQLEFPAPGVLPEALNFALKKNPNAQIFVLSEYSLDGGVTDALKKWCREHARFLVVGGKDLVTNDVYYNTAFVVDTNGEIVFRQAKSVPIQFFKDGLPARQQDVWNSPWGKIGLCICYDLSYTRVTDELIRRGAQLLIVPTMDMAEWGKHQHELHSRVAPVRAMEYGVPIFRVASSGISQAVDSDGNVIAKTSVGGVEEILSGNLSVPSRTSLPLDRILAPGCVLATTGVLLVLAFNGRIRKNVVKF
jgi:apolipoprotein N-acyltransferase